MAKKNPYLGSTLESLLREDGTYEDAKNQAIKSVLAYKLEEANEGAKPLQGTDGRAHGNQSLSARPVCPTRRTKA